MRFRTWLLLCRPTVSSLWQSMRYHLFFNSPVIKFVWCSQLLLYRDFTFSVCRFGLIFSNVYHAVNRLGPAWRHCDNADVIAIAKKPLLPRSHIRRIRQLSSSLAFCGAWTYVLRACWLAYTSIRHRYTNIPPFTLVNTSTVITGLNK